MTVVNRVARRVFAFALRPISRALLHTPRVWGDRKRVYVSSSARLNNTLLNTISGDITVGPHTFAGHNVSILTGTHDMTVYGKARMDAVPTSGYDVVVGSGVWLGSNATIIGPCVIGDHAVVAAGAVVTGDVPPYAVVAGVPARLIKTLPHPREK